VPVTASLGDVVDLERYPIDNLESPACSALVDRCRRELDRVGACDLEGFAHPDAIASVVDWAIAAMPGAYRTEMEHNVYFTDLDSRLPADDPRRIPVRSAKAGLANDEIPTRSPLRIAYESSKLTAFVGAAVGVETLYRHADPLGALNVMFYTEADELGWHFDGADFVVTLLLQPPLAGGRFEYVPKLRTGDDENYDGVRSVLAGDSEQVRSMSGAAGTLALFRGHNSIHRATPIVGKRPRINAVLSYSTTPNAHLSDFGRQLFYGRSS
jgi:hypothetical protein